MSVADSKLSSIRPSKSQPLSSSRVETRHSKVRILLVDDRPENLLSLQAALAPLDQELVCSHTGEDALRNLLQQDYAVVLLDVNLPGIDGFETARLIREREQSRHTPIIFLTAMDHDHTHATRGYSLGAVDFLFKPIDIDVLRAKVSVFVELHRKTEEIARLNSYLEYRVYQRTQELEKANTRLKDEVKERRRIEKEVRQLNVELEERVRQRTAELESANSELEAFSYSVSHDLRAPLRKLDGLSRILREDFADSLKNEAHDYLRRIENTSKQMTEIVDDLLILSQITHDEIQRERFNLSHIAHTIAYELNQRESVNRVDFHIQDQLFIDADPRLIQLALRNLLENAWKFSSKIDRPVVEFGKQESGERQPFYVRDNGAGFEMRFADIIFSPFSRLHAASEYPGTGIGLAIVKRVVQRHGGAIWVESTVNHGATFYFTV